MKTIPVLLVCSLAMLIFACSKDKFETKPLLKITSISSKDISPNEPLTFHMEYFDKEGDLGGGPFFMARIRLNKLPVTPSLDKADTIYTHLPDFPNKDNAEINQVFQYDFLHETLTDNDTLVFRFAVADKAGHASDTITTDQIVIHHP